ncbi:MAG: O-methyltransferase [Terracidiphilus sp.]|jgi:predicted O-methyltransferase YrrM
MQDLWTQVDDYYGDLLAPADEQLEAALQASDQAGLPSISVSRLQGKFLEVLVRISGARRVLEIGTLGGYSTIWMARALPEGGRIITLEFNPHHAEVAQANLRRAGVGDQVDLRVGRAIDSLPKLVGTADVPFDLIFIDADKECYSEYLDWSLKLSRPGTVIVADNVVRQGKVVDPECDEPRVQGIRQFAARLAAEPRLSATAMQTVGAKGYDGLAVAVVLR